MTRYKITKERSWGIVIGGPLRPLKWLLWYKSVEWKISPPQWYFHQAFDTWQEAVDYLTNNNKGLYTHDI